MSAVKLYHYVKLSALAGILDTGYLRPIDPKAETLSRAIWFTGAEIANREMPIRFVWQADCNHPTELPAKWRLLPFGMMAKLVGWTDAYVAVVRSIASGFGQNPDDWFGRTEPLDTMDMEVHVLGTDGVWRDGSLDDLLAALKVAA